MNNAGLQHVAPIEQFPPERFSLILRIMLEAPFLLIRAALPAMYARGWGRVINISSVHGLRASAYKAAYVGAKHGLEGLSKVVALEGAEHGVTSNCIDPGYVRTPLVESQIAAQAQVHGIPEADVIEQILLERSALKRLVEPTEVAELAAYLCSPAASFMTRRPSRSTAGGPPTDGEAAGLKARAAFRPAQLAPRYGEPVRRGGESSPPRPECRLLR